MGNGVTKPIASLNKILSGNGTRFHRDNLQVTLKQVNIAWTATVLKVQSAQEV
jgi:hypothetical protein